MDDPLEENMLETDKSKFEKVGDKAQHDKVKNNN